MNAVRDFAGRLPKLLAGRFPDIQNILGVYAVIVFLIYSWTLITSFYMLPSWLFYLSIGQILSMYAYFFSINLVESILVLVGILLLEFTLFYPLKNKDEFQSRSILTVFALLVSTMTRLLLYKNTETSEAFLSGELTWWVLILLPGILFAVLISKNKRLRSAIEAIAERVSILLFLYTPLSLISLLVVIIRNIN